MDHKTPSIYTHGSSISLYRGQLGEFKAKIPPPAPVPQTFCSTADLNMTTAVVHVSWLTKFNPLTTSLCLRLVSPSRLAVSMWHIELASLEFNNSKSAGMISSLCSLMKSPTTTFFHAVFWYSCVSLKVIKHNDKLWLVSNYDNDLYLIEKGKKTKIQTVFYSFKFQVL